MIILKKFKKHYFYIILILIISNNLLKSQELSTSASINLNLKKINLEPIDQLDQNLIMHFLKQPKYTESGIICFLKHTYNNTYYAEKFLAFNFSHLTTLLDYSKKSNLPRQYIYNILSLFNQKFSETYYVNSYAFLDLLEKLTPMLKPHFDIEKEKQEKITLIQKELYQLLTDNFEELKKSPEVILLQTSSSIYNILQNNQVNQNNLSQINLDLSISDIKPELILLLSNIISKLVWSPADQEHAWNSVKNIANYLIELLNNQILDAKDIDILSWYLITRFSYFISNFGDLLNLGCYSQIYKDLEDKELFLFTSPERERYIKTKAQYLQDILYIAEMKSRMLNKET